MTAGDTPLAIALAMALALSLGALALALTRLRRMHRRADAADPGPAGAGATLVVEDGRVVEASPEAEAILGPAAGPPAGQPVAALVEAFAGEGRAEALAALARLEATGEPVERLVHDGEGRPHLIAGAPRGGQLHIRLAGLGASDPTPQRAAESAGPDSAAAAAESAAGQPAPAGAPGAARHAEEVRALSGLLAAAPVVAWSRTEEGSVTWCAGRIETRLGGVEAAKAAALAAARPPTDEAAGPAAGRGAAERFRLELTDVDESGAVALEAVEVPAPGGGRYGLAVDASAALEAERTLARFVGTMTETFAHLNVGLAIFDRSQRLALFNPALVEMWRADPAWLARRPGLREILDALRANRRVPESADFRAWRKHLTRLFEDPETADYDELWHLADGSDIRVLARPHPHGSLAFVFEDVTERLRLEQQYRHSIDLRRATLDRLDEGLAVFGPDGRLQFVNAAFHDIWGTDAETVRPLMHVHELVPLVGGLTVETEVWSDLTRFVTGATARQPWTTRVTLGTGRILSARCAGLPDGATMAVFADVTDSERIAGALRERNEALEAAEEMRAAVLDQISHRLRTPLHTIFGFGQLLVDPRFGPLTETQKGYAEQILESARHLLGAVDDVTELAELDTEPFRQDELDLALGDTLVLTARLLEKRAGEQGVTLRVSTPEDTLLPDCEPRRLRQIVFGLATAAIGSAREGGEIEFSARAAGKGTGESAGQDMVELRVGVVAPAPEDDALPPECPSLPFIRRLIDQAGGALDIRRGDTPGSLSVVCRFPARTPAAEDAGE